MVDLSKTITAKSDQLNADDLLGGPITITIEDVKRGTTDQPIAVFYQGCNGKPWYPCKSMRRVLVAVWGNDGKTYAGKSCTLYRDPEVKFGGIKVGGIRISHMSHIDKNVAMALQVTKGSKRLYTVKPLVMNQQQQQKPPQPQPQPQTPPQPQAQAEAPADLGDRTNRALHAINNAPDVAALQRITGSVNYKKLLAELDQFNQEQADNVRQAASNRAAYLNDNEFS